MDGANQLSDRARRIDLSVGVDYDTPPERVLELREGVARAHSEVLSVPAPQAVFIGFGDSAINYELRAWTSRFERWSVVETELAAAVYRAVRAAGVALPFPQRVVRVLGDAPGPTATPRGGPPSPAPQTIDTGPRRRVRRRSHSPLWAHRTRSERRTPPNARR